MNLSKETEEKIKEIAMSYLEKGKPNWDIPHTLAAVYWIRELIKIEGGNEKILVTTMYLHDIGYPNLQKGYDFNDLIKVKKNHAQVGSIETQKILRNIKEFSEEEIKEITFLIMYHDTLDKIKTFNQQMVMEADSLAQLDIKRVKPNFDKPNCMKYLKHFNEKRALSFKTLTGKEYLRKILKNFEEYIKEI